MWFKNLTLFRLTEPFNILPDELASRLAQHPFRPCGQHEQMVTGWTSPLGRRSDDLLYAMKGYIMLCAQTEEKILPAAVINEATQERILIEEEKQQRKLARKERTAIKDNVIAELLPRAFTLSRQTYAYIDIKNNWLIVDAAATGRAEDLVSLLRQCLGSLPAVPPVTVEKPATIMTRWLTDQSTPNDITIENECELRSRDDEGAIIRCKRQDLSHPEIKSHLDNGKQVVRLALTWSDRLACIMDESLSIKRLRFLDLVQEQTEATDTEDEVAQFAAEFAIMATEVSGFLQRIMALFGGISTDE